MKPGRHTASNGVTVEFSRADLAASAAAYSADKHEAPLVIGHPKNNGPAHGWAQSLLFNDSLEAIPHQVQAEFAESVNSGAFKKVSTSFYPPNAKANPVPGVWYVRHIGFFGADPVAVKGMRDAQFAEAGDGIRTLDFSDIDTEALTFDFSEPESPVKEPSMSDKDKVEFAERESALKAREDALKEQQAALDKEKDAIDAKALEFAEQEAKARREEIGGVCNKLESEGRLLPRHKAAMIEFMAGLDDGAAIEFAEEGKITSKAGQQWFREWLQTLPKQVDFEERSAAEPGQPVTTVDFAAPQNLEVNKPQLALLAKARAYQSTHDVDFVTAVAAVGG